MEIPIVCAALALVAGAAAQPEPTPHPRARITEAAVLAAIGRDHTALWETTAEVARARAAEVAARTLDDPALSVEREAPDESLEQWTWALRWRPPLDGRRALGIEASEAAVGVAELHGQRALSELRLRARADFASWATAHDRAEVLERAASTTGTLLRRAEARAEVGEGSRLEARRLSLALLALEAERDSARAAALLARAAIEALVPDLPVGSVPQAPPLVDPPGGPPADPLLHALRAEAESLALEERVAAQFFRFPEVTLGWQRVEDGPASVDGPVAGIELSLPLFDRNRARRLEVEGRISALAARIAQRERDVASAWRAAREVYVLLRGRAAAAAGAVDDAGAVVAGAEAAFRLGESDLGDLLEALRAARETELSALDLHAAALEALRQLDALAGGAAAVAQLLDTANRHDDSAIRNTNSADGVGEPRE